MATLGSAGDLHPFLAVARELAERGHHVTFLSQPAYEAQVRAEGIADFVPVVSDEQHRKTLNHPLLWHPLQGFGVLWRHLAVPAIEPTCLAIERLLAQSGDDQLTVFASPMAAGARFARERWPERVRLLSGYTAPMGLRSVEHPMFLGEWKVPKWLPKSLRWRLWDALDRWKLEPMANPTLTRWQSTWETAPIQSTAFGDWLHSPDGGIAMYPDWFAPVPNAWRDRGVSQTGFPVFNPRIAPPLPLELAAFLAGQPRYAVIYPGSAASETARILNSCLLACRARGLAVLVLSPHLHVDQYSDQHGGGASSANSWTLGDDVMIVQQAPLPAVLPGAQVFIHHGGIGSTAQAFAHDTPQLILASAYDQFENGARVESLQLGFWQRASRISVQSMGEQLDAILNGTKKVPDNEPSAAPASPQRGGTAFTAQAANILAGHLRT